MKKLIMAMTITFALPATSFATTFWGPVLNCTLSNSGYVPSVIKVSVYSQGLFSPSEKVQILYRYPEFEINTEFSLISELSTQKPDSQVYVGQISNIDHLVDVVFDMPSSKLTLQDNDKTFEFTGECVEPNFQ